MARVGSLDDADKLLRDSAAYLRANAGPERYDLLRALAHVAAADGVLHTEERAFLYRAAELLDIPRRAADEVAFDVLADALQVARLRGLGFPRPKLPRRAARPIQNGTS